MKNQVASSKKKQIRSHSYSPLVRHNNRIENNERKNNTDTETLEENAEKVKDKKIRIRCFKRKLKSSILSERRSEIFKVIDKTVSTMFLITHHIYQFLNIHILRICNSFKDNNYQYYDDNQKIIYKFDKHSLRKVVEMLIPLERVSENIKKGAVQRNQREFEEKIDNTSQNEEVKETIKTTNKDQKDKKREKLDITVKSLELSKTLYLSTLSDDLIEEIIPLRDTISEIVRQSLIKFLTEFNNMWNANRYKTFVRFLQLVFKDKIADKIITKEDINQCANGKYVGNDRLMKMYSDEFANCLQFEDSDEHFTKLIVYLSQILHHFEWHNSEIEKNANKAKEDKRKKRNKRMKLDMSKDQSQPQQVKLFSILPQKNIFSVDFVSFSHEIINNFFHKFIKDANIKEMTSTQKPKFPLCERARITLDYFFNFKNSKNKRILKRNEINHIETDGYSLSIGFVNKGTKELLAKQL